MPLLPTAGRVYGDQGFDISARPEGSVRHIDDAAIAAVTNLYREVFPAGGDHLAAALANEVNRGLHGSSGCY